MQVTFQLVGQLFLGECQPLAPLSEANRWGEQLHWMSHSGSWWCRCQSKMSSRSSSGGHRSAQFLGSCAGNPQGCNSSQHLQCGQSNWKRENYFNKARVVCYIIERWFKRSLVLAEIFTHWVSFSEVIQHSAYFWWIILRLTKMWIVDE